MNTSTETVSERDINSQNNDYLKIPFWVKARPYLIMTPALLITIGIVFCFFSAIFFSFTDYSFRRSTWELIGLENWTEMLVEPDFWHSVLVTFQYALTSVTAEMFLGLGIAILLNYENFFTKFLKVVLIFPLMIAPVIATLIWQLMTNTSVGVFEKLLNIFGIYNFPWAASSSTALFTAALVDIWVFTPFVIVLASAGLQSLPKSPFEAAKIDGGSPWFTFKSLTLPMLKPVLYIALIFRLMAALQEYAIIFALTKGGPGNTLMNLSLTAYNKGFAYLNFGESLPYILVLWLIIFFISKKLVSNYLATQMKAAGTE